MRAASCTGEAPVLAAGAPLRALGVRPRPATRLVRTMVAMAIGVAALSLVGAAWRHRGAPLRRLGAALVAEDRVGRGADVAVVSMASPRAAALDAAKLYRRGLVREIWIPRWSDEPADRRVDALGVHTPRHHEVARQILERAGVPAASIVLLDEPVDGLDAEMAVVGAALRQRPTIRPIVLTARTHTARARLLLRDAYAPAAGALVRGAHADPFALDGWWRRRAAVREVALEYAKWMALLTRGPSFKE
jgi:uncharacterized SAM-binding protein YcdF (DUF218 family)